MFYKMRLLIAKRKMIFWSDMAGTINRLYREEPNRDLAAMYGRMKIHVNKKWVKWSKRYTNLLFKNEDWYTPYEEES